MVSACAASFIPSSSFPFQPAFIPFAPAEHRIPFARVPRTLLVADGITLRDFKVYTAILSFPANAHHERWPGREKIGELTGLPVKVVSRTTTHLQKLGWLAKQGDGGRSRTTRYVLFDRAQPQEVIASWEWQPLPKKQRKPSTKPARKQRTNSAQTGPVSTPQPPVNPPQNVPETPLNGARFGEGQAVENLSAVDRECSEPATPIPDRPLPPSRSGKERTTAPDSIPDHWIEVAQDMRPDLTADQITRSASRFLDFHRGKGSEFKDWQPIWRIWISKERPDHGQRPQTPQSECRYAYYHDRQNQPPDEATLRAMAEGEQRRVDQLMAAGIDPATGLKLTPPVAAMEAAPSPEALPEALPEATATPAATGPAAAPTPDRPPVVGLHNPIDQEPELTPEEKHRQRQIADLAANGLTLADARAARTPVRLAPTPPTPARRYSPEQQRQFIQLAAQGLTPQQIRARMRLD